MLPGRYSSVGTAKGRAYASVDGQWDYYLEVTPLAAPIPTAAWLFGSDLLRFLGIMKRKVL